MTISELGSLGEAVAALATIAMLGYLALQIRQSTASTRWNAFQTWVNARAEVHSWIVNREFSAEVNKGIVDPRSLSHETWLQVTLWLLSWYQIAESIHFLYKSGAVPEERWRSEMEGAAIYLSWPGVKQWWEAGARTQLSPSFVSELEAFPVTRHTAWHWTEEEGFVAAPRAYLEALQQETAGL